ncbi:MAG: hypothetical protein J6Q51_02370 [Clostridia bacterium]|nr:hypothetical protein [Clostridia bacterium]
MATKLEELQKKEQKLIKQLNSVREISRRRPIDKTTMSELVDEMDLPPYWLTMIAHYKLGPETYDMITEEPANGRVRGKVETALNKTLGVIISGTMTALVVPFVAIAETPIALPTFGILAGQSALYTKYNKNIEKAKKKVFELEEQLSETLKQIKQEQEKQNGMEL